MRSAIQANRGQTSILQGLPAETPETPVLISKIYQFFSFSYFLLSSKTLLTTCAVYDELIQINSPLYRRVSDIKPGKKIQNPGVQPPDTDRVRSFPAVCQRVLIKSGKDSHPYFTSSPSASLLRTW